ncbi:hypothetical protein P4050_30540 [Pseudomonas aeruginosa]|nr:hypothetical protein [Pseudomonas aeruginosa]
MRTAQLTEQPTLTRLIRYRAVCAGVVPGDGTQQLARGDAGDDAPGASCPGTAPDESEDLTSSYQRLLSTLDNGSAYSSRDRRRRHGAAPSSVHRWIGMGRAERSALPQPGLARYAASRSRWVLTHADDLTLVATVSQLSTALDVRNIGYARFANGRPGRRDIRIELHDGTVYHRRILTSTELDADTERLAIDAALGRLVEPGDVARICFMALCSAATDVVEIEHVTDSEGACNRRPDVQRGS